MTCRLIIGIMTSLGLWSCTPAHIQARQVPVSVISQAQTRLGDHGIRVDPTGQQPQRLRSIMYCFKGADRQGFQWSRAFSRPAPALVSFTHSGDQQEHKRRQETCKLIFRVIIEAEPLKSGSRIHASSEWWKLHLGRCRPIGNALLGKMTCSYSYRGTRAPRDVRGHLYGILKGL